VEEESESNPFGTSEEEEVREPKRRRGGKQPSMDFMVEIPKFEGQLNPDEFLHWMNTVERAFEYKDIPDDKKVKLVALKLCKYASIWWNNVLIRGLEKGRVRLELGRR